MKPRDLEDVARIVGQGVVSEDLANRNLAAVSPSVPVELWPQGFPIWSTAPSKYGGGGSNAANLRLANPRTIVRHCTFRNSSTGGVVVAAGAPVIELNDFTGNVVGIDVLASALSATTVRNNSFDGNSSFGLRSVLTAGLVAQLNAWGDPTGPGGIGSGTGDTLSGNVLFEPWLESEPSPGFEWVYAAQSPDPLPPAAGTTGFFGTWNDPASWNLEIRNSSSTLVRSFTGTGAFFDQTWDGKDALGSTLPDGSYTYTLAATKIGSSDSVPTARGTVTLSSTLPVARITSPDPFDFLSGTVPVQGTAAGTGFTSYTLAYKAGVSPTSGTWTTIATSSSPVTEGVLGNWNTSTLTEPIYTLRLTVQTGGGPTAQDQVLSRVLAITSFAAAPPYLSPNGDSIKDATALGASMTWPADWTLTLSPAGGGADVRTFTGTSEEVAVPWNGTNELAQVVPDGGYEALLESGGDRGRHFRG